MFGPDDFYVIPLAQWIRVFVKWVSVEFYSGFNAIKWPVQLILDAVQQVFVFLPPPIFILAFALVTWKLANRRVALGSAGAFVFIAMIGVWTPAMITLALITTAIMICIVIGIPLGIWCARSDRAWRFTVPVLDVMQTTPTFVYLVPIVMFFGANTVSGEIAVILAALPPLVRFTNLGLRMVPKETIEAGTAFGATDRQLLWEVQLPLAMPTILGGLNQTVLQAMVMAVIISLIGAEGLGMTVLKGLGRLDVGTAAVGGIAIVLMAIVLDRITQTIAAPAPMSRHNRQNGLKAAVASFVTRRERKALG